MIRVWNSVNKKLPKSAGRYLCAIDTGIIKECYCEILNFTKNLNNVDEKYPQEPGWYRDDCELGNIICRKVKYWMELPKGPKC